MNILVIHPYYFLPGGYGNDRSSFFCNRFVSAGHSVYVITTQAYFPEFKKRKTLLPYRLILDGVHLLVLPVNMCHYASSWIKVFQQLYYCISSLCVSMFLSLRPHIVYCISTPWLSGFVGIGWQLFRNTPFIYEVGDLWPEVPIEMLQIRNVYLKKNLYKVEKYIYKKCHALITLSPDMSKVINKRLGYDKAVTIYNGTDTTVFRPDTEKRILRSQFGIVANEIVCIYAGTIGKANGLCSLVSVWHELEKIDTEKIFRLLLLGNGNDLDNVIKLIKMLNLQRVTTLDWVPKHEVITFLQISDYGILWFEPLKVLQSNSANKWYDYLASGLPVITNCCGWQKDFIDNHACGFYVEGANAEVKAQHLYNYCLQKSLRNYQSTKAREVAVTHFDRAHLFAQTMKLFRKIVSENI